MLKQNLKAIFKNKKGVLIGVLFLFACISLSALYFYKNKEPEFQIPRVEYAQAYSLTNDKISQSAGIAVYLPPNIKISKNEAQKNTKFTPEIKGSWVESNEDKTVIFKPDEILKMGRYYTATLEIDEKTIENDFLIVDDPKVLTVFPKVDSEASEDSEITVMFNRPMVPITTLDVLESYGTPIEIYPPTEGKYKWIGTATAQFIPTERLTRSSNYTIRIKPDFVSMDGLSIDGYEHKFTTRKLRYEYLSSKTTIYNKPIRVKFNQPLDLRKTTSEIELVNTTLRQAQGDSSGRVEFIAEYGTKSVYNDENNKYEESEDKSVILVYNKRDKHGREKLWDFEDHYNLKINKAYPLEGDIFIDLPRETSIQITGIIKNTSASSERTNFATPDFFDPEGKLWIEFYEGIDLTKSKISADRLTKIGYGEKCKENDGNLSKANCEKEDNKNKIYLEFDYYKINNSDVLKINLEKIINTENLQINNSALVKNITVIPDFKILRTIPDNNNSNASLSEFIICSNSPLTVPADEDINKYLKADLEFEFKNWQKTNRVPNNYSAGYYKCHSGEFETRITYGLMPERWYNLEIKVNDHFGKNDLIKRNFKTGKMPEHYLNFYNFQKSYNVTTPEKTKLTYAVENMDYINLQICELDSEDMLNYLEKGLSYREPVVQNCQRIIKDKIDLPQKYWIKNYFTVNLKDYLGDPLGHYILTFSHPDYKERYGKDKKQVYERTSLTITNLGVVEKKIEMRDQSYYSSNQTSDLTDKQQEKLKNIYWVTTFKNTESVEGAKVQLFERVSNSKSSWLKGSELYYTNNSGITETAIENNLAGVIVSKGSDSALISNRTNKLQYGSTARSAQKIYTYTDRPIYRPGHEVYLKGLYRIGYDGDYEIFQEEKILVKVFDSKNKEIFKQELEVSEFGTFDTKLILDTKASLGRYRIDAKGATTYFDVQEYVPAPFKVETKTDREEYISGDTFNLNLDASYYFGAPVEGGEVEYAIASQDYYFDKYKGEYFNFGSSWYYCYDCSYGDKFILRNKTEIDNHGKAKISAKLDLEKLFKDDERSRSKIFVVHMTVKNSSGQSISTQKSFIVHRGEYYLGLKTDKYFLGKNESFKAKVKSVDTTGKEVAVNNINLKINKIQWVQNKRKEVDGGYYYKWEKKLELVKEKKFNTDQNGNWSGDFSLDQEGSYEIILTSKDSRGNTITSSRSIYVHGKAQVDVRRTNDEELEIVVEKSSLQVGDQAEIIIKSPYKKAKALVSVERGKIFDYEIINLDQSLYKYSVDVPLEYIPNFYISVVLLSPDPEIKYGHVGFQVDTGKKELDISIKTDKEFYLPGEEVKLNLQSRDSFGNPAETELSVAVADLSVLALKGNPKKNPLAFFYGGFPLTVSTASNLKNVLYELDIANAMGSKGGGGADAEDLAKKKRGIFKDTAFWQAIVETDKNGKAEMKFTLPDNLTTWQIEAVGISKDTKLGVSYNEIIARKDIMVTPLKPRFVIPGDEFYIGAKIFNQTNKKQDLEVNFSSATLSLKNDQSKKDIQINANESKTIYFNVLAEQSYQNGVHQFILSAKNNEYEDTVENSIKITRNDTYEATATAGYSSEEIINEFVYLPENIIKDKGSLTIKHSATLAVFLSDALNYLVSYPYGCSEQVASKLNSIAIVKKGLDIKNVGDKFKLEDVEFDGRSYTMDELVEIGLIRIYENQKSNGGFAYYPDGEANIYPTLHIAKTLKNLKDAGYEIDEDRLRRAFSYINSTASYGSNNLKYNKDLVILAVNTLSELKEYGKINSNLIDYLKKLRNDKLFLNEKINNTSLAILAITLADNEDTYGVEYKNEVFDILENRIDIDSRGAFLPSGKNTYWQYYATPTKDTALLLKALTRDKRDNKILDKVLRWLLRSRSKDGAWGSTNNTVTVVDSLVEYLIWQRETESEFNLKILLDGEEKQSFDYQAENILDQNELKMSVNEFEFGTLNNLAFKKENKNELKNNFYYDASLKYFLPIDTIPPRDEGFAITREFYELDDKENENPVNKAKVGDVLRGHIKIFLPAQRNFVAIEDFIPAGVELVNFDLSTESSILIKDKESNTYNWWRNYKYSRYLRPNMKEMRDDRLFIFNERLPEGEYEFDYYIRVLVPGKFHHLPAVISEMYFPENFGRTSGRYFEVE